MKKELDVIAPFDALKKWYKLEPGLFRVNPEEFWNMAYEKMKEYILEIGVAL
ncbi:MAG: hypothetical protein ACI9IL_000737 [Rickettsiales bacterium]